MTKKNVFWKTIKHNEDGQNLVEFALVFGLIIVVFIGMVEMTNLFQEKADLENIVNQAARQAGEFGGGGDQVEAYINYQLGVLGYNTDSVTVTIKAQELNDAGRIVDKDPQTDECTYGEFISVQISKEWDAEFLVSTQALITGSRRNGSFNVSHTNRCWRAG